MAKLTPLQQYGVAAAAGAVVCFCLVMAWQQLFTPVQPIDSTNFNAERTQLEAKAAAEATARQVLETQVQALTDTIELLRQVPTQIHQENETTRFYNWNLSNDSASALLRARLAAEDTHRLRYVYGFYALPGKTD